MSWLTDLFKPRIRLPRDQRTKVPRAARKAGAQALDGMKRVIDELGAMPGIADVKGEKRVPRGYYEKVDEFLALYDAYIESTRQAMGLENAAPAGTPEGAGACCAAPMTVSSAEALRIYREVRAWRDFPKIGQGLAELAQQQFTDIQTFQAGTDPEKMKVTGRALQQGRQKFAVRGQPCPLLDEKKQRCRVWEHRPLSCRMHHVLPPTDRAHPQHDAHDRVDVRNIRIPMRQQAMLQQLDKRMDLGLAPFIYAGVLQLLELAEGELIPEVGEAVQRMGQDGRVQQRANRNVRHAKKFKGKGKGKGKGKPR